VNEIVTNKSVPRLSEDATYAGKPVRHMTRGKSGGEANRRAKNSVGRGRPHDHHRPGSRRGGISEFNPRGGNNT
jgi:hypothetical protein